MADQIPKWARVPKKDGWCIQVTDEDGQQRRIPANGRAGFLLGRNGQVCDVEIVHKSASRVHACIAFDDEGCAHIVDLGSTHGTFVDGLQLEKNGQKRLVQGRSVITIGHCATEVIMSYDKGGNGAQDRHEDVAGLRRFSAEPHDEHQDTQQQHQRKGSEHERHLSRDRAASNVDTDNHHARDGHRQLDRHRDRDTDRSQDSARGYHGAQRRGEAMPDQRRHDDMCKGGRDTDSYRSGPARGPPQGRGRDFRERGGDRRNDYSGRDDRRHYDQRNRREDRRSGSVDRPTKRRSPDAEDAAAVPGRRVRKSNFDAAPPGAQPSAPQQTPAQIVRAMMGGNAHGTLMSVEQKKKLLWGKKAEEVVAAPVTQAFGANRWDTAQFSDDKEKDKFIKLMGVRNAPTVPTAAQAAQKADDDATEREVLTGDKQNRLLHDVEAQFMAGLRRADGRTVGLGL